MTRFCIVYSLEAGVVCLCTISILISGGLICNHQLKLPAQIRDWRKATIYSDSQLDLLDINVTIATWVLVGDILCTLLMILPVSLTEIETPWKERNLRRKFLIPCVIGKLLCILHGITGFVWILWKFHHDCPEIIGILLALALYVFLGLYVLVVVISYYLQLGMRLTFHKLKHSASGSSRQSQDTQMKYQRAELAETEEIVPSSPMEERKGKKLPGHAQKVSGDALVKDVEYKDEETHTGSRRKLNEYNDIHERKLDRNPNKKPYSSQEALDAKLHKSQEKLQRSEADEREEQYRRLLNKSRGSQEHLDEEEGRRRKRENVRQIGPDQMEYRVSEREESDGGGKRRYYYKRDKRDMDEKPAEQEDQVKERSRQPGAAPGRARRESDDSLGSMGRIRSPPRYPYAPPRRQSDGSYDSNDGFRNDWHRSEPQSYDPYDRPVRHVENRREAQAPKQQSYHRDSDDSGDIVRSPPSYKPPLRLSDSSQDSYGRVREERHQERDPRYYDPPRRYEDEPIHQPERPYRNDDYVYQPRLPNDAQQHTAYENDNEYDDDDYEPAPPYIESRYDQDGYISSEV